MTSKNIAVFNSRSFSVSVTGERESNAILTQIKAWALIPGEVEKLKDVIRYKQGTSTNDKMYAMGTHGDKVVREFALIPNVLYHNIAIALKDVGLPDWQNWFGRPDLRDLFFSHFMIGKLVKGTTLSKEGT